MIDQQLRRAIKKSFLSQYAISQLTGIDTGVISRFVRGERDINMQTGAKLAKVLRLKLADK